MVCFYTNSCGSVYVVFVQSMFVLMVTMVTACTSFTHVIICPHGNYDLRRQFTTGDRSAGVTGGHMYITCRTCDMLLHL